MTERSFGICRLATVPMRHKGADSAEMISQLLYGEHYSVLEESENKKWIRVRNAFDDYEGWIDKKQHTQISKAFFDEVNNSDYQISTDLFSEIEYNGQSQFISIGAVLPILSSSLFNDQEKVSLKGGAKPMQLKLKRAEILRFASALMNTPYYWGGRSSFGIDCSGFTQLLYRLAAYKLPRDSSQQILAGEQISLSEALPGDLAFFNNQEGRMNHVGLLYAADKIIHASGKVRLDKIDSNGIFNDEQKSYTHHLFMVKRYLPLDQ